MKRILLLCCCTFVLCTASCSERGSITAGLNDQAITSTDSDSINRSASTGGSGGCYPTVGAVFNCDSVTVTSTKDLSNVVIKFCDGSTQKFDGLNGYSRTLSGTGANACKAIKGVWIKSGCNASGDGPGYGEWVSGGDNCNCTPCTPPPCDPPACTPPPSCDPDPCAPKKKKGC
jgi:hypothetical protein